MLTNSRIVLSVALVLATASTALAAPRHAVRHHTSIARHVPANAYLSLATVRPSNFRNEPTYMRIQDIGFREYTGY
jgi:hypothetical protein